MKEVAPFGDNENEILPAEASAGLQDWPTVEEILADYAGEIDFASLDPIQAEALRRLAIELARKRRREIIMAAFRESGSWAEEAGIPKRSFMESSKADRWESEHKRQGYIVKKEGEAQQTVRQYLQGLTETAAEVSLNAQELLESIRAKLFARLNTAQEETIRLMQFFLEDAFIALEIEKGQREWKRRRQKGIDGQEQTAQSGQTEDIFSEAFRRESNKRRLDIMFGRSSERDEEIATLLLDEIDALRILGHPDDKIYKMLQRRYHPDVSHHPKATELAKLLNGCYDNKQKRLRV